MYKYENRYSLRFTVTMVWHFNSNHILTLFNPTTAYNPNCVCENKKIYFSLRLFGSIRWYLKSSALLKICIITCIIPLEIHVWHAPSYKLSQLYNNDIAILRIVLTRINDKNTVKYYWIYINIIKYYLIYRKLSISRYIVLQQCRN